jgi:hypothetical protein
MGIEPASEAWEASILPLLDEVSALCCLLRARTSDGSDYLFTSQKGGRVDRAQFFCIFRAVAESAGLPAEKRPLHVLKHSLDSIATS